MENRSIALRPAVLAGVAVAVAGTLLLLAAPPARLLAASPVVTRLLAGELAWWGLAAVLLVLVAFAERRPLATLGLRRPRWSTVGWGVLAAVAALGLLAALQVVVRLLGLPAPAMQGLDLAALPLWLVLAMALRAGVVEEVLFRGFLLERLAWLSGRTWVGALLSLAFFVAVHAKGWSAAHLLFVAAAGGLLTLLYVRRRDLGANIVAHVLTDVAGLTALWARG